MKYFYLTSTDRRTNDFVFYKYWERPGLYLTPELEELVCRVCKKLDQDAAIRRGLSQGDIRTRVDWFHATDGPLCVSAKGKSAIETSGAEGLTFQRFLSARKKEFWMVASSRHVPTERSADMTFGPACAGCGRYRYILGLPRVRSFQLPADDKIVFESSIPSETEFGLLTWLVASQPVVDRLRAARLSGFRCFEVDP